MTKRFKDFIKKPIVITAEPVHGGHARPKIKPSVITAQPVHGAHAARKRNRPPIVITAQPVHGAHAKVRRRIQEAEGQHGPGMPQKTKDEWGDEFHNKHLWTNENPNPHLGDDHDDVHKKLSMSDHEWKHHPHKDSLYHYSLGSNDINNYHIARETGQKEKSPHQIDHEWDDEWEKSRKRTKKMALIKHSHNIDKAMRKSSLKHDVHVYHGLKGWNPSEEAAKHPERKIKLPAYTSTSIHRSTADNFAGEDANREKHVLHIHLKKGQKGIYLGHHSHYDNEREMLLPRGTTLKIHKHKDRVKSDWNVDTIIHHAHVVDDK